MDYYRLRDQKVFKDLNLDDLVRMVNEGSMASDDLVRLDGQEHYVPVLQVERLKRALEAPTDVPDSRTSGSTAAVETVAGQASPAAFGQEHAPRSASPDGMRAKSDFESAAPLGRIGRRKSREDDSDIDLTPMIDVVFLLLIFFIITHTLNAKPPIDLPEAMYGKGLSPEGMQMILIDKEGQYFLGEKAADENRVNGMDELIAEVTKKALNAPEGLEVLIDAHPGTDHGNVRKVAEEISQLENVVKISLGVAHKKE